MTEAQFIIEKALSVFNAQHSLKLTAAECDLSSIPTRTRFDRSYQIATKREDDYVVLHLHLSFGKMDSLSNFGVELDKTLIVGELGDELHVAYGLIDRYWIDSGKYKFPQISYNLPVIGVIIFEDGSPVYLEDGGFIVPEAS